MTSSIASNQRWHVQCSTALTSDTSPSFLLVFDDARYLFNCGENTTRAFTQDRISLKKLKSVFLTRVDDPMSMSGLGGLLLSIGEREGSEVSIYGPEGTDHFLASSRYHTRREKLKVNIHHVPRAIVGERTDEHVYQDSNVTVFAFPALPEEEASEAGSSSKRPAEAFDSSHAETSKHLRVAEKEMGLVHGEHGEEVRAKETSDGKNGTPSSPRAPLDWFARDFSPSSLSGSEASEWRASVVQDMFRGGQPVRPQPSPPSASASQQPVWYSSPAWNQSPLPPFSSASIAVSYLVIGPAVRGKFKPEEAKAQGVKPGPDFGRLQKGESVTLADGKVVLPETVYEPGAPPASFAIISCPSQRYIPTVISSNSYARLTAKTRLKAIFHLLGEGVLHDARYQKWIHTFPEGTEHIVSSPEVSVDRITFASAALLQLRLARLDDQMFRLPQYRLSAPSEQQSSYDCKRLEMGDIFTLNGTAASSSSRLRHFNYSIPSLEAETAQSMLNTKNEQTKAHSAEAWAEYLRLADEVQDTVNTEAERRKLLPSFPGSEILVTPLGTGSAVPSKYRNVSSTLLEMPNGQAILLDAGEGTYGQLSRLFGSQCTSLLQRLCFIFISHMHADHHAGLAHVLSERAKAGPNQRLYIACPPHIRTYIRDMNQLLQLKLQDANADVLFIDNNVLLPDKRRDELQTGMYRAIGNVRKVETVLVEHRARCFGIVIEGREGWKIVFSGDTKPCQTLLDAGQDATLLIHEATIEDDMPEMALYKGHSTFGQAIDVAKKMRAKHCLLTHFSQRYPKLPPLQEAAEGKGGCEIAVAFDLMSLRIGDIWKAKYYSKAMQALFSEYEEDEEATEVVNGNVTAETANKKGKEKQNKQQKKPKKGKE